MYGNNTLAHTTSPEKNPNRVTGGLKAQGVDRFTMLGEDGMEKHIPTVEYVHSLEEQLRKQRAAITVLERKLTRCDSSIEQLKSVIGRS
jgi:hypothetical protein|tara:strand:+ start:186 stop:452 length:267 start_codon:yes stop_codon:yes gene_type:complete